MSFEPPIHATFSSEPHIRRFAIDEMDAITLAVDVHTISDEHVPAGTVGTVVAVWGQAEAFEVEFDEPYTGTATVEPRMIREHRQHD